MVITRREMIIPIKISCWPCWFFNWLRWKHDKKRPDKYHMLTAGIQRRCCLVPVGCGISGVHQTSVQWLWGWPVVSEMSFRPAMADFSSCVCVSNAFIILHNCCPLVDCWSVVPGWSDEEGGSWPKHHDHPHHVRSNSSQIVQKDNFQVIPHFRMTGIIPKSIKRRRR